MHLANQYLDNPRMRITEIAKHARFARSRRSPAGISKPTVFLQRAGGNATECLIPASSLHESP
jgi:hypothetical protein